MKGWEERSEAFLTCFSGSILAIAIDVCWWTAKTQNLLADMAGKDIDQTVGTGSVEATVSSE